jgi:hypothetical protein
LSATIPLENGFQAGGINSSVNARCSAQNQDELSLAGHIFCTVAFKTSAFVSKNPDNASDITQATLLETYDALLTSLQELSHHLGQSPNAFIRDMFHILTMQSRRIETLTWDDPTNANIFNDLRLFLALVGRLWVYTKSKEVGRPLIDFNAFSEEDRDFTSKFANHVLSRCFCIVKVQGENRLGLIPERAKVGDSLAVIEGLPAPLVLRRAERSAVEDDEAFVLVGDAYVISVMQGELAQHSCKGERRIILI